jgi:succinoglycan biosynthesis transport protein ExoP
MKIQDGVRVVRERWRTVAIVAVILGLAASAGWFFRPKEYTASLALYVSAQPAYTTQTVLQSTQLSPPVPWSTRMTSYVELLTTPRVSDAVIQRLRLPITAEDLSRQITASSATDSVLITVEVTDRSPQQAALIANTVGTAFGGLVDELERPLSEEAVPPVAVKVLRAATVPTEPSSLSLPVMLTLGLLSGAALGVGVALVRDPLNPSAEDPGSSNVRHPVGEPYSRDGNGESMTGAAPRPRPRPRPNSAVHSREGDS